MFGLYILGGFDTAINPAILLKEKDIQLSFKNIMGKHADSTDSKILRRIHSRKRGWVVKLRRNLSQKWLTIANVIDPV